MTKKDTLRNTGAPQIIGFVCNWGAYSGVEMAGVEQRQYPENVKLVRLPCLGRLHLGHILKSFEMGAGGVVLLGCPPDDCNYDSGSEKAKGVMLQAKQLANLLGINQKRLDLIEVPVGGSDIVAERLTAFVKQVNKLDSPKSKSKIPVAVTSGKRS
ncbi:MAG: hydrogenase iron-sulfur subunit [Dehalococcoidales bacterium]|nr:hydrogenase iron-sulfur subunit [Dehalococcoidales bacterium]